MNIENPVEFNKTMNSFGISKKVLNFAREKYRYFLVESKESSKSFGKRKKSDNNKSIHCNLIWPICAVALENNKLNKNEIEYFIYKQGISNTDAIFEDYFANKEEPIKRKKIGFVSMKDNLVIGRMEHCCFKDNSGNNILEQKPFSYETIKKLSLEGNELNSSILI